MKKVVWFFFLSVEVKVLNKTVNELFTASFYSSYFREQSKTHSVFIPLIVWHFRCNIHLCKCNDFIRTAFMTRSDDGDGGVYCDCDVATMDDVNIDVNGDATAA